MPKMKLKEKEYYKIDPKKILEDVLDSLVERRFSKIKEIEIICFPHVYPSDRFRTTNFLLESIEPFLKKSSVCDMGCGPGIVGLYALTNGAKKVVQCDINPYAVENAKENQKYHEILDKQLKIYQSDCFDHIPTQKFDIIVFNIPFHSDPVKISDPLEHAFFDPGFMGLKKFLRQAEKYSIKEKTKIFIAFSNKGDIRAVENIFTSSSFAWELWKIINQDQTFDNRIYLLRYPL